MEKFVYIYFVYLLDIIKIVMLYKSLVGKNSRNKKLWFLVMAVLLPISYIHNLIAEEQYIIFFYFTMITLCMLFIINDKLQSKVMYSMLFIFFCSYLDSIFAIMIQMVSYISKNKINVNLGFEMLNICCGILTIVVITEFGILRKKFNIITLDKCGFLFVAVTVILIIFDMIVLSFIYNNVFSLLNVENIILLLLLTLIFAIKTFAELALVLHFGGAKNYYREKVYLNAYYLSLQKDHYHYLAEKEKKTKKFRHDLKNHLIVIDTYAKRKDFKSISLYLNKIMNYVGESESIKFTNNEILDAIINKFHSMAVKNEIKFKVSGHLPVTEDEIDAFDLCTVFSNILSNAFEAVEDMDEKYVELSIRYKGDALFIKSVNGYKNVLKKKKIFYETTKMNKHEHGMGMENINEVVNKYEGDIDINTDNSQYTIVVLLQCSTYK